MKKEFNRVTITLDELNALRENFMEHNTADAKTETGTICFCERCDLYRAFLAPFMLTHIMEIEEAREQQAQASLIEMLQGIGIHPVIIAKDKD